MNESGIKWTIYVLRLKTKKLARTKTIPTSLNFYYKIYDKGQNTPIFAIKNHNTDIFRINIMVSLWCGKCRALRKRLIIVFSEKSETRVEDCPVPARQKKQTFWSAFLVGAGNGTWTRTSKIHAPQTCASADSATPAWNVTYYTRKSFKSQGVFRKNILFFEKFFFSPKKRPNRPQNRKKTTKKGRNRKSTKK